jgi:phosphoglycolate phosphatase
LTAVLFDLDGVLADSRGPIGDTITAVLAERGLDVPPDLPARVIGPPLPLALQEVYGMDPGGAEVAAIVADYRGRYRGALRDTPGFPGVPEALSELAEAGLRLGVATSKPLPFAELVLDTLALRDRFAVVAAPALDGTENKTQTVERALTALGPGVVAMVGDRRFDIEAARALGLLAVGVTWGIGSRAELEAAGAEAIVDQPAELVPLLLDTAATRASRSTRSWTTGP